MKTKSILLTGAAFLLSLVSAFAADLTGKWTGEMEGRNGTRTVTFNLKSDGSSLTGSSVGPGGREIPIADGKVDGDNVSFSTTFEMQGNTVKSLYTGTASAAEMKLKVQREGGNGQARDLTLKKAQ